jgi:hypothetical protein
MVIVELAKNFPAFCIAWRQLTQISVSAKFISRLQHRKDIPQVPHLALHMQSHPVQHMSSSKEGKPAEEAKM